MPSSLCLILTLVATSIDMLASFIPTLHLSNLLVDTTQLVNRFLCFLQSLNSTHDYAVSHVHQILNTWDEDDKVPDHITLDELPNTLDQYTQDKSFHATIFRRWPNDKNSSHHDQDYDLKDPHHYCHMTICKIRPLPHANL